MNKSSITPTIGRKVWLWAPSTYSVLDPKQAFDATVVYVGPDGSVNLSWTNHWGTSGWLRQVELRDPSDQDAHGKEATPYATWMPYQMGQAKQQFAEAKKEEAGS